MHAISSFSMMVTQTIIKYALIKMYSAHKKRQKRSIYISYPTTLAKINVFLNVYTPYIARLARLESYMARRYLQTFINIYCCKGTLKRSICFSPFLIKTIYIWSKQNMHLLWKHYKNMMRHKRSFMSIIVMRMHAAISPLFFCFL